jgi:chromosome segregation ATPase
VAAGAAGAAGPAAAAAAPAAAAAAGGLVEGKKAPPLPDNMTLADVFARWTKAVAEQKRGFDEQAAEVRGWDYRLRRARVGLAKMTDEVSALKREQVSVEASLSHVDEHNRRLETMLGEVERYLDDRLGAGESGPQPATAAQASAQQARSEAYTGARRVESLLRTVDERLQAVGAQIAEGLRAQEAQRPRDLSAATAVLNALVASLTDVEEAARGVERKAGQLRHRLDGFS